jgi:hypothetical protein
MSLIQNNELEEKAVRKSTKREKKRRPKMKVSGAAVKDLHRIMNIK